MITLVALLFATTTPCDVEPLLRTIAKSSLSPQTARNVTAKVRYAEALCKAESIAPRKPQEELAIAREWASADRSVTRAIDGTLHSFEELHDLPARLTIRVGANADLFTIDGIALRVWQEPVTVLLRSGTHEVWASTSDLRTAAASITLAEGETRSLELKPVEEPRPGHFLSTGIDLVTAESVDRLCIRVHRGSDGVRVPMTSIDGVTIEKRGAFDATSLFALSGRGDVCVAEAAALRQLLGGRGPFVVRLRASLAGGQRIDNRTALTFGREVVVRGTVPDSIHFVQLNGRNGVPVNAGRFTLTVPEGPFMLVARADETHYEFFQQLELHCDAEVRLTREKAEIVQGGCLGDGGEWREHERRELWEDVQFLAFQFTGGAEGAIKPHWRSLLKSRPMQSEDEVLLQQVTAPGALQVRAYGENGTVVFRTIVRLQLVGAGCFAASNSFSVDLPMFARYVEIKGWSPQTSGRFDVAEFSKPPQ